ncbi:hypothetical protein EUGRSUZ_B01041 [Eucalyptus grandis]|uniref:Uncharacterized protein n=2 Tax=Eucalyptus grandis TaxID=71139 RepID=A0ACC3LP00_EUCGR|nr:hypothetical protein EUGRSUZ_B01041 [Eucalyptus grandis]
MKKITGEHHTRVRAAVRRLCCGRDNPRRSFCSYAAQPQQRNHFCRQPSRTTSHRHSAGRPRSPSRSSDPTSLQLEAPSAVAATRVRARRRQPAPPSPAGRSASPPVFATTRCCSSSRPLTPAT